jgi:phosphoglucomutase
MVKKLLKIFKLQRKVYSKRVRIVLFLFDSTYTKGSGMSNLSKHLSEEAVRNINEWLTKPKYAEYKDELARLIDDEEWQLLEDSFFKVIEFGTGGRRGTTGIGSNRINRVTMGESAQALCQYAATFDPEARLKGIVIACDTRLTSKELSEYCASVCAANGFKTYIFENFRATPELSFAVRFLGAAAGIVVSASHNPPMDNGFKAYWSDGGQIVAPHDKGVLEAANDVSEIFSVDFSAAVKDGRIKVIGKEVDDAYIAAALEQSQNNIRDLNIVYSPLHGAGQTNVLPLLRAAGFEKISCVEDQMSPDGNFPTVEGHKANPEERIANDRAVSQMMAEDADIAITNDPDADRIGVMVRQGDTAIYLSGNESAVLATDYALQKLKISGSLSKKHYIAKTIVTTDMLSALAESYGVTIYTNLLIGFKYISELVRQKEEDEVFVIGGEESYGLLKGSYTRDKDGAAGALPLAEYAAELKAQGKTLYDRLRELYVQHGVYRERLDSAYFEGASGFRRMQEVMAGLRSKPPVDVDGQTVTAVYDYDSLLRTEIKSGKTSKIDCIRGNIVVLECNNDYRCRITIRPSGTEPKIKIYTQWYAESNKQIDSQLDEIDNFLENLSRTLEGVLLS